MMRSRVALRMAMNAVPEQTDMATTTDADANGSAERRRRKGAKREFGGRGARSSHLQTGSSFRGRDGGNNDVPYRGPALVGNM